MRSIVLDANLLVLLIVGLANKNLISQHKRTRSFMPEDFDLLSQVLSQYDNVIVTANVMTEASNLASQISGEAQVAVRKQLALFAESQSEVYCRSSTSVKHREFLRLGLTDCALIELVGSELPLLTTDLDLYLSAARSNHEVVNFNHLRQARLLEV